MARVRRGPARSGALVEETAAPVSKDGGRAIGVTGDAAREADVNRIVNISSTAGRRGLAYRIGYCSAKAGRVGMTYGMALELAPHKRMSTAEANASLAVYLCRDAARNLSGQCVSGTAGEPAV